MKWWKCLAFDMAAGGIRSVLLLVSIGIVALLFPKPAGAALASRLVQDINANSESALVSSQPFAVVGGVGYFRATDPEHGMELWRSDGTEAGTWMVIDLAPGSTSSSPQYITA